MLWTLVVDSSLTGQCQVRCITRPYLSKRHADFDSKRPSWVTCGPSVNVSIELLQVRWGPRVSIADWRANELPIQCHTEQAGYPESRLQESTRNARLSSHIGMTMARASAEKSSSGALVRLKEAVQPSNPQFTQNSRWRAGYAARPSPLLSKSRRPIGATATD